MTSAAGRNYIVEDIQTDDEELKSFLFSLGCYSGEPITVIAHLKGGCTVSIKDGRYNIDKGIARGCFDIKNSGVESLFFMGIWLALV